MSETGPTFAALLSSVLLFWLFSSGTLLANAIVYCPIKIVIKDGACDYYDCVARCEKAGFLNQDTHCRDKSTCCCTVFDASVFPLAPAQALFPDPGPNSDDSSLTFSPNPDTNSNVRSDTESENSLVPGSGSGYEADANSDGGSDTDANFDVGSDTDSENSLVPDSGSGYDADGEH